MPVKAGIQPWLEDGSIDGGLVLVNATGINDLKMEIHSQIGSDA